MSLNLFSSSSNGLSSDEDDGDGDIDEDGDIDDEDDDWIVEDFRDFGDITQLLLAALSSREP